MRPILVGLLVSAAACSYSQAADGLFTRAGRPHLVPEAGLWNRVHEAVARPGKPLGYTFEEMLGFPPFEYRLRSVENLFRDVLHPAEYGALIGNNLLDKHLEPAQELYMLWSQLDARAGREWKPSDPTSNEGNAVPEGLDPETSAFAQKLIYAAQQAAPYLQSALDRAVLGRASTNGKPTRKQIYDLLVSPYLGDVNDDTIIVQNRSAYDAMRNWDKNYSAFGTALFMRHFDAALAAYKPPKNPAFKMAEIRTPIGTIRIAGTGDDTHNTDAIITIDLGGNDTYKGLVATPTSLDRPISVIVDLQGDDTYDGTQIDGNVGCGLFGLGLLYDQTGDDQYSVKNGGIGFGLYGTGAVIDAEGDDTYDVGKGWGQGAAYAGVGLLLDRKGDDKYNSICMSMGFGGTMGVGALVDVEGNDSYFTADTGNQSKVWGKTVSMSLGCGYGRRCDSGDGQNQGGGVGIVVEGAGDDTYHTSVFSLGSGYWWGAGIFEERGGNDTYRCTQYSIGSGAHFAVGSFVDMNGNDRYNDRPDAQERWGGIARDGCLAVCIDADGDDIWGNLTGGHADLNSYALFWDIKGNDVHKRIQPYDPKQDGNRPFGSATTYPPMLNFRDRLLSGGIFLDTGGRDVYPDGMGPKDNSEWQFQKGPLSWSIGIDQG